MYNSSIEHWVAHLHDANPHHASSGGHGSTGTTEWHPLHSVVINSGQPDPPVTKSDLSGTKRALLIGINYYGSQCELSGCINDIHNVLDLISADYGFSKDASLTHQLHGICASYDFVVLTLTRSMCVRV